VARSSPIVRGSNDEAPGGRFAPGHTHGEQLAGEQGCETGKPAVCQKHKTRRLESPRNGDAMYEDDAGYNRARGLCAYPIRQLR
jgi:hypothetical protein